MEVSFGVEDRVASKSEAPLLINIAGLVAALEEEDDEDEEEEEEEEEEEVEEDDDNDDDDAELVERGLKGEEEEEDVGSSASRESIWALFICIAITSTGAVLLRSRGCRLLLKGTPLLRSADT